MAVMGKAASKKRLIDVNDIYSLFNQNGIARLHVADIDTIPMVDAVEVVRCKDCKFGEVDDADFPAQYLCKHNGADWNDENHFCSYGERKEGTI